MKKQRYFWGIACLAVAVFLIVEKLGFLGDIHMMTVLLTIVCAAILISSIPSLNFAGILFPLAFLCIIYDEPLGLTALTPWTVLAVALFGSIGLTMLFHKRRSCGYRNSLSEEVIDIGDSSVIRHTTHFGAATKYINTDNFKQADLSCSFGALSIYFENAAIPDGIATVRLNASFSGIELYMPKEWNVENHLQATLGGIDVKNHLSRTAA